MFLSARYWFIPWCIIINKQKHSHTEKHFNHFARPTPVRAGTREYVSGVPRVSEARRPPYQTMTKWTCLFFGRRKITNSFPLQDRKRGNSSSPLLHPLPFHGEFSPCCTTPNGGRQSSQKRTEISDFFLNLYPKLIGPFAFVQMH